MRNWLLISLISIIFVSAISGAYVLYQKRVTEAELTPPPPQKPDSGFPTSSPGPETSPESQGDVLGSQPQTGITSQVQDGGIIIISPQPANTIASPITVSGFTKISSGQIIIRAKDQNGTVLGEIAASTCANFEVCSFETTLFFEKPIAQSGTLEVYSPQGNSTDYLTQTVVQFN